jgi:peptidyl-dipeptidase Dcp
MSSNIFFKEYETPYHTIPFDKIKTSDYKPAFLEGFKQHLEEIDKIVKNTEPATFENTIAAFEYSGEILNRVQYVFFNLLSAESTDEMQDIANEISPLLSDHFNNIYLNKVLFNRVKSVYDKRKEINLTIEQTTLIENIYDSFENKGATLSIDKQNRFRELSKQISLLQLKYGQNLLKATNEYQLLIADKNRLAGLPERELEAAQMRAQEKQEQGYLFDLTAPSYIPFMKYEEDRDLRKQLYIAYNSKTYKGKFDNSEIVKQIVSIRLEMANILGYKNYATMVLRRRMAETPENVYRLLDELLTAYKPVAEQEMEDVKKYAYGQQHIKDLMPWDWAFISNQLKKDKFNINDEMTRPYFDLKNVKKGVFGLATRLYGITFKKNEQIPVYNKEVEVYEVNDADNSKLAILYVDFHPRKGKQGGAWMTEFLCQHRTQTGENIRPQISLVMNLTRPTSTQPSLLSIDELQTFMHEFGHAIHGMVANTTYESLAGTNVYRDFVELPSQLMENWATEKAFLDDFAKHYQNEDKIPEELINKIKAESNFNIGYATLRQLCFGYLDMAWHTIDKPYDGDIKQFEKEACKSTLLLPGTDNTLISTQFSHIFDGGYAAGYYSYKWAEVLDADAFALFKQNGIFDKSTAKSFRTNVLEKGGTEHPMILYKRFRGKNPQIEYLLRRNGISK